MRDELNKVAPRRFAVLNPLLLSISNFKNLNLATSVQVQNHPTNDKMGERPMNISESIYIGKFLRRVCDFSRLKRYRQTFCFFELDIKVFRLFLAYVLAKIHCL